LNINEPKNNFISNIDLTLKTATINYTTYLGMGAWILMKKLRTPIPYAIVAVGSAVMIGIYMVAILVQIRLQQSLRSSKVE
jgi:hypothetical protein